MAAPYKKIMSWFVIPMMTVAFILGSCAPKTPAEEPGTNEPATSAPVEKPFKVGLIIATGGLGDQGFNDINYKGVVQARDELGIVFDYVEPKEIAEYESHERAFAQQGDYDLIIGLAWDQADAMKKVAAEFPDQKWMIVDGVIENMDNVRSITFKDNEKASLAGVLAGHLTSLPLPNGNEECTLGFIGGMDIPLIRAFASGFISGARYVNPECKVIINYVGGWADSAKAKEIALAMYDQNIDIIYTVSGGSGLGVFEAAKERNLYAIGSDANQNHVDPDHIIYSTVRNLDTVVFNTIKQLKEEGTLETGWRQLGVKEGAVGVAFEGSNVVIPQDILDEMEAFKQLIISGDLVIPSTLEEVDAWVAGLSK